jgi:hypothetical protein
VKWLDVGGAKKRRCVGEQHAPIILAVSGLICTTLHYLDAQLMAACGSGSRWRKR